MNDERLLREVGAWLQESDPERPDADQSVQHAMERMPRVRQRSRWWPFPVFYRRTHTPAASDTAAYEPDPIPATNGHTPTVIGRTHPMLSPAKAITAGALIFAIGGAFLIAQPFDQQGSAPGADADGATTESSAPTIVTGWSRPLGDVTQEPTEDEVDGVTQSRGSVREGDRLEMDDPRVSGLVTTMWNTDLYTVGDVGAALVAISKRIENDEGSWSGSCTSLAYVPPKGDLYVESCLMTGAGAYDGLSAYLVLEFIDTPNSPVGGLIFAGDLPPMPEIPSAE